MKRWIAAAAAVVGGLAASVPAEPAGACSIYCPEARLELELVEVRLADPAAEAPEELPVWPATAELSEWGSLWFPEEGSYLELAELVDEGVE